MITLEITKKGIQRVLLKHDTEDEETEDFAAYQVIKPRLMAIHAVLKDHFKNSRQSKEGDSIQNG